MYDLNIHSEYSINASCPMEKMVQSAIEKKAKVISFTDNIDLETSKNKINIKFRVSDYLKEITSLKYKYSKSIEIYSGIEIGMQPHLAENYAELVNKYPFDFVLMSIHTVSGDNIIKDKVLNTKDIKKIYFDYYSQMLDCVKSFNDFDVLGHLDFIDTYVLEHSGLPLDPSIYDDMFPIIEDILKIIILKNKGLELNTSARRSGLSYFYPKPSILKLYRDLGGEIITIGSNANNPEDICYQFKEAEKLLKTIGFDSIYYFKDRKRIKVLI